MSYVADVGENDNAGFIWVAYLGLEQHIWGYFHIFPVSATSDIAVEVSIILV